MPTSAHHYARPFTTCLHSCCWWVRLPAASHLAGIETATTGQRQLVRQGGNKAGKYKTRYYRQSSRTKWPPCHHIRVSSKKFIFVSLCQILGRPEIKQTLPYSLVLGRGNILKKSAGDFHLIHHTEVDCRESAGVTDLLIYKAQEYQHKKGR